MCVYVCMYIYIYIYNLAYPHAANNFTVPQKGYAKRGSKRQLTKTYI